jgi:predicted enzyme related to lactoylglutathione lyase
MRGPIWLALVMAKTKRTKPKIGDIAWRDLTVKNAPKLRDFYVAVAGWKSTAVDMGGYEDFCMNRPGDGETVAGICHARGDNANLPAQWLLYINVANLRKSLAACRRRGGKIISPEREMFGGKMAVIQDPAGAVVALFEPEM